MAVEMPTPNPQLARPKLLQGYRIPRLLRPPDTQLYQQQQQQMMGGLGHHGHGQPDMPNDDHDMLQSGEKVSFAFLLLMYDCRIVASSQESQSCLAVTCVDDVDSSLPTAPAVLRQLPHEIHSLLAQAHGDGPHPWTYGDTDATGTNAKFKEPWGLAISGTQLYVADYLNSAIRVIDTDVKCGAGDKHDPRLIELGVGAGGVGGPGRALEAGEGRDHLGVQ